MNLDWLLERFKGFLVRRFSIDQFEDRGQGRAIIDGIQPRIELFQYCWSYESRDFDRNQIIRSTNLVRCVDTFNEFLSVVVIHTIIRSRSADQQRAMESIKIENTYADVEPASSLSTL